MPMRVGEREFGTQGCMAAIRAPSNVKSKLNIRTGQKRAGQSRSFLAASSNIRKHLNPYSASSIA